MARSVKQYSIAARGFDYLDLPTTVHIYPFPFQPVNDWRARLGPIRRAAEPAAPYPAGFPGHWPALALALLERASQQAESGGLWGHSWEIEKYKMWDDLEQVLAAALIIQMRGVTNSELVSELKNREQHEPTD